MKRVGNEGKCDPLKIKWDSVKKKDIRGDGKIVVEKKHQGESMGQGFWGGGLAGQNLKKKKSMKAKQPGARAVPEDGKKAMGAI